MLVLKGNFQVKHMFLSAVPGESVVAQKITKKQRDGLDFLPVTVYKKINGINILVQQQGRQVS